MLENSAVAYENEACTLFSILRIKRKHQEVYSPSAGRRGAWMLVVLGLDSSINADDAHAGARPESL